jgi:hypothetical protein
VSKRVIVIDSGALGYLVNKKNFENTERWFDFVERIIDAEIRLPAIIDYESGRNYKLEKLSNSIINLDKFRERHEYLELTDLDLDLAKSLWAYCRSIGKPTTNKDKIDVDVILVAQAISLSEEFSEIIIITSDPRDLSVFQNEYNFQIWDWRTALDDIERGLITFYKS